MARTTDGKKVFDTADLPLRYEDLQGEGMFHERSGEIVFGLSLDEAVKRGFLIRPRTVVEMTKGPRARMAGAFCVATQASTSSKSCVLIDPFCGSGSLVYEVAQQLHPSHIITTELDGTTAKFAQHNLNLLNSGIEVLNRSFDQISDRLKTLPKHAPVFVLIDPPWQDGYDQTGGMD